MRKIGFILLIFSVLVSCVSSKKHLNRGEYDLAINKSVKKLKKNPRKEKEIKVLEKAYRLANQQDNDRIVFLRQTGEPQIWDEVFDTYSRMSNRQDRVKVLNQNVLNKIKYVYINYNDEIIEAKRKAAEYFYVHGSKLLDTGGKDNARLAYNDFIKVKKYYTDYRDVDAKINKALELGRSYVLFRFQNQSPMLFPAIIETELNNFGLSELDQIWYQFDNKKVEGRKYDNIILVNIKTIDVSPETVREERFSESKEIVDGWQYVLDSRGNVMKDSLGNDIKVPKYKTITCYLVQTFQNKSSIIGGTVDIMDGYDGRLLKSELLSAANYFEKISLVPIGDIDALTPETKKKLTTPPVPFPSNIDMLMQSTQIMKDMTKSIVRRNMYLLR